MPEADLLALSKMPVSADQHLWGDYAELCCISDPDRIVSKADIVSHIRKRRDIRVGTDDFSDEVNNTKTPRDVAKAAAAEDLFRHLEYRAHVLGDFYPFTLSPDGNILTRRKRLTSKTRLYLFFLLAANTGYISSRAHRDKFTDAFESASAAALKTYLPKSAKVHLFGSNALNRGRYSGAIRLRDRIKALATDLGEKFIGDEGEFPDDDYGDNGLDIVAWIPFRDTARGTLLILSQCACSITEWPSKQSSSSEAHWRDIVNFKVPPTNMLFVPFFYRRNSGDWHLTRKIDSTIMVDRQRLISLLARKSKITIGIPESLIRKAFSEVHLIF